MSFVFADMIAYCYIIQMLHNMQQKKKEGEIDHLFIHLFVCEMMPAGIIGPTPINLMRFFE